MTRAGSLAELRRLAEAATPGPWGGAVRDDGSGWVGPVERVAQEGYPVLTFSFIEEADAAYISAANPKVILALLDRLAVARFVAEHWRDAYMEYVKGGDSHYGIGTHPLALVLAALDGETDPRELGLPPDADESLAALAASHDPEGPDPE